jgi:hypothetical protein
MKSSSYILVMAFNKMVHEPDDTLYARLNLLYFIFDWVKARLYFENDEDIHNELKEIEDKLKKLRQSYRLIYDQDFELSHKSRLRFEEELDEIRFRLINIVENFELLDESVVSEFFFGGAKR